MTTPPFSGRYGTELLKAKTRQTEDNDAETAASCTYLSPPQTLQTSQLLLAIR